MPQSLVVFDRQCLTFEIGLWIWHWVKCQWPIPEVNLKRKRQKVHQKRSENCQGIICREGWNFYERFWARPGTEETIKKTIKETSDFLPWYFCVWPRKSFIPFRSCKISPLGLKGMKNSYTARIPYLYHMNHIIWLIWLDSNQLTVSWKIR